jgi:hypothetical protein
MSEYQYYEFRSIDRPLTKEEREEMISLSSRADVTSSQAKFVYHYGDFRGDVEELMITHFDMMLYVANWGSKQLMFRLPSSLVDINKLDAFFISDNIDFWLSKDKQYIILDLNFNNEDEWGDWIEGEGLLDELIDLREELIQGDFRILYLAWLDASERALEIEDIDEETLEPPVPNGLKQLSNSQKAYIKFLNIDSGMVAVASQKSGELEDETIDIEQLIDDIPEEKKYEFLVRLSRGEQNLSAVFNRYVYDSTTPNQPQKAEDKTERRSISTIISLAEAWHKKEKEKRYKQQEIAKKKSLELLAKNKDRVWEKIYQFIDEVNGTAYDRAVERLKELQELSKYQGEEALFQQEVAKIKSTYSRRQALLRRMRSVGLVE